MIRVGIDIGGTFTDLVLWDDRDGRQVVFKLPSTPDDPSRAAMEGLETLCRRANVRVADVDLLLHGTTVATNIILERNGAKVGLITTKSFRDILHIGRKKRPFNFSNQFDLPRQSAPIARRRDRIGVTERVLAPDGRIETPLDDAEVRAAAETLKARGVEAVAICFLNAYLNPIHEQRAAAIVAEVMPNSHITTSHAVVPLFREYERFSTTALDAFVGPKTGRYIERFATAARSAGLKGEVRLMTSAGGTVTARGARAKPVSLLLSGPVAGLVAGIEVGRSAGFPSVVSLDVGGTSADIGVAAEGKMRMKHLLDTRIGAYDAMLPMVDIETIGAGGGSIARVDSGGFFRVGPESAGAMPGPAAYGRGGTRPTVTDALVVLGWLGASSLARVGVSIDADKARAALAEHVARPLGLSVEEAAAGTVRIVTQNMVDAIALASIAKGFDVRGFGLVGLGGAGPLFAGPIAHQMGMAAALVPLHPGVGAAAGLLSAPLESDVSATCWAMLDGGDLTRVNRTLADIETRARAALASDGFTDVRLTRRADCRYRGQGHELSVPVPSGPVDGAWVAAVVEAFHQAHERAYLRRFADKPVQLVNLSVTAAADVERLTMTPLATIDGATQPTAIGERAALFPGRDGLVRTTAKLYDRDRLRPGQAVHGPAVIEQFDATTIVPPGFTAKADRFGTLVLAAGGGA